MTLVSCIRELGLLDAVEMPLMRLLGAGSKTADAVGMPGQQQQWCLVAVKLNMCASQSLGPDALHLWCRVPVHLWYPVHCCAAGPRAFTMQTGSRRRALDTLLDLSHVVLMTEVRKGGRACRGYAHRSIVVMPCFAAPDSSCIHVISLEAMQSCCLSAEVSPSCGFVLLLLLWHAVGCGQMARPSAGGGCSSDWAHQPSSSSRGHLEPAQHCHRVVCGQDGW